MAMKIVTPQSKLLPVRRRLATLRKMLEEPDCDLDYIEHLLRREGEVLRWLREREQARRGRREIEDWGDTPTDRPQTAPYRSRKRPRPPA